MAWSPEFASGCILELLVQKHGFDQGGRCPVHRRQLRPVSLDPGPNTASTQVIYHSVHYSCSCYCCIYVCHGYTCGALSFYVDCWLYCFLSLLFC